MSKLRRAIEADIAAGQRAERVVAIGLACFGLLAFAILAVAAAVLL